MLSKLTLVNFQAHTKMTLELDKRITVLTGPSDVGKSSVLRALEWLCLNRPSGNEFIHHGKEFAKVTLEVDDRTIIRKRGKENQYFLDEKEFKALGQGTVPQEISALLNVGDPNFQNQLHPPYWFLKSPGEVSRELNSIVNLGEIDRVLSNLASMLRQTRARVLVVGGRLDEAKTKEEELEWVRSATYDLEALEQLEREKNDLEEELESLESLLKNIQEYEQVAATQIPKKELQVMDDLTKQWIAFQDRIDSLKELMAQLDEAKKELDEVEQELEHEIEHFQKETKGENCPVCGNEEWKPK